MKLHSGAEVHESSTTTCWFDAKGILCMVSKSNAPKISLEERKRLVSNFIEKQGGKKICGLMEITHMPPADHEAREFNTLELPKIFHALAFVSNSAIGKMIAQMYLGLRPSSIPAGVFSNEEDARTWLEQYL
jgi:hypothetical protein